MLGNNYTFNINYNDNDIRLKFNMQAIKNLYTLTGISPFEFLSKFITESNERDIKVAQLIYSMTNGNINLSDIMVNLLDDQETVNEIWIGLHTLMNLEMKEEFREKPENDSEEVSIEVDEDKLQNFIDWYNYMYYTAKVNLSLSECEFLDMTPREIKTMDLLNKEYNKNIMLSAYITVAKANNKVDKKEVKIKKEIATASNNIRIRDLLMSRGM